MSVRKRIWTNAKGETKEAWVVDYVDKSEGGKRRLKSFDRKKDATAFAATATVEVREGVHTADSASVTIAKAGEFWIATAEKNGLERSTVEAYRQHLKLHIRPYLGSVKLSQLSAPMVRQFEDKLARGDSLDGQKAAPRSPAMVKKIRTSLSSLISDAQERGLISRNVVRDLRAKRKRGAERRAEKRQKGKLKLGVDIPTREEIKAIVTGLTGRWRPVLLTAIFTGLRSSELRGLRWEDVDFEAKRIHVRQRADRFNAIGAPKSESGERSVPLPPVVINTLREWKLACPRPKPARQADGPAELLYVFPNGRGQLENHANIVNRGFIPVQIAAGVTVKTERKDAEGKPIVAAKYTGLHPLRHFYASWCINRRLDGGLELPAKSVQERLGHSSIVMTMDVYGHLFPRSDDGSELADAERSLLG
jgi:integrase